MQENNYQFVAFRIVKIDCTIDVPPSESPITIAIEDKLSSRRPADPEDTRGMLKVETQIISEDTEKFKIDVISETVFSFDKMPDDFDRELQNKCYPMAKAHIQSAIKAITTAMGITPLDLAHNG